MKGLSLWQPWATLIAIEAKQIETRSWKTPYRGRLAIHAAAKFDHGSMDLVDTEPFRSELVRGGISTYKRYGKEWISHGEIPRGSIVAVCDLIKIVPTERIVFTLEPGEDFPGPDREWLATAREEHFGDYSAGRFGWILGNIRPLPEPIPYRGSQGLWEVDAVTAAQIERQAEGER